MRPLRPLCILVLLSSGTLPCIAQVTAAAASAAPTQGTTPIESQIISYRVLGQLAKRLADAIKDSKCVTSPTPATCTAVLLSDTSTTFEMTSYPTFMETISTIENGYGSLQGAVRAEAFSDTTSAVGSLITAIKSSAVYTNANFQPTPQLFLAVLNQDLHDDSVTLRTSTLPGDQASAALDLQADLKNLLATQAKADKLDPKILTDPQKTLLTDLDKQVDALQSSLSTATPDGTLWLSLIKGRALTRSLGNDYAILTVSLDAAGGDSKVTHYGIYEIFFPTPAPAYNGGAVISYTLAKSTGELISADAFTGMYDFEKLKATKLDSTHLSVDPAKSPALTK